MFRRRSEIEKFLAVAEAGKIVAAADRLAMTQPALTRAIARLERRFGAPLFERLATGVRPTALGATVAAIRLLLPTGCRKNEIVTLRWDDIDRSAGAIRLRESKTWVSSRALSRHGGPVRSRTPSVLAEVFAILLAILASVLVSAMPTPTGKPVHRRTVLLTPRQKSVTSSASPVRSRKHPSMDYFSVAGASSARTSLTRLLMSV